MGNHWTTPVKLALVLSLLCVVATVASGWVEWQQLQIMREQQIAVREQSTKETVKREQEQPVSAAPLIVASVCSMVSVLLLGGIAYSLRKQSAAQPVVPHPALPPMSIQEIHIANNARGTFMSMLWHEKFVLREIYRTPGIPVADLVAGLIAKNFSDPDNRMIATVRNTNLIDRNFTGNLHPSPDPVVRNTVVQLLEENPL